MSLATRDAVREGNAALQDAMALASLARNCVASGVERRVLHIRLSLLPPGLREAHHQRLVREALAPLLRPTRARLYELPGGDLVALSPPPGEHLEEARRALARLLPDIPANSLLPVLHLPAEAARLLTLVEAALGLGAGTAPEAPSTRHLPPPTGAELDAAQRALTTVNLTAFLRRQSIWRLASDNAPPEPLWTELRPHLADLAAALLPGRDLSANPSLARRFRQAAERRMLAELAHPKEARALGDLCLPLTLGAATQAEFLHLDALLGPQGRARLLVCIGTDELLADPGGFVLLRRFALMRGWILGLDGMEPPLLRLLPAERLDAPLPRLHFRPGMISGDATARASLDATLPRDPARIILMGADTPAAIAWGWQRGITRFMGRMLEGRLNG